MNAMKSACSQHNGKLDRIYNTIKKEYAEIRYEYGL